MSSCFNRSATKSMRLELASHRAHVRQRTRVGLLPFVIKHGTVFALERHLVTVTENVILLKPMCVCSFFFSIRLTLQASELPIATSLCAELMM